MAIDKMNEHYSFTNPASIYDEEALTALELAGRQAKKINEVVEAQNNLDKNTNETLARFEKATIPAEVEDAVNKHIEKGTFDEAIDDYIGGVEGQIRAVDARVNNLLTNVVPGTTSFDGEIMDGRFNHRKLESMETLGQNLQAMYLDSLSLRDLHQPLNANNISSGYWWVSSGMAWENVPMNEETGYPKGGYLLAFSADGSDSETVTNQKKYQLFLCADGCIYFRIGKADGNFFEWEKCTNTADVERLISEEFAPVKEALNNQTSKLKLLTNVTNVDTIDDNGFYFVSSSTTYENLPDGENAGLLIAYKGLNAYSKYQLFVSFATSRMYVRSCNVDTTFKSWKKLATVDDIPTNTNSGSGGSGSKARFEIVPKTDIDGVEIYETVNNGYIRYTFGKDTLGFDNKRILKVEKCNKSKEVIHVISDVGHDIEGVVKYNDTFYGGVHGSESINGSVKYYIDGQEYIDAIPDTMTANHIRIYKTTFISIDFGDYPLELDGMRAIIFDDKGVEINNYIGGANMDVCNVQYYFGMLSAYKTCCPYISTIENLKPNTQTFWFDYSRAKQVDMYGGGVNASIRTMNDLEQTEFVDYDDRYKVYFIYSAKETDPGFYCCATTHILKYN